MRRIPRGAALLLATGLVLAGCGTDEDEPDPAGDPIADDAEDPGDADDESDEPDGADEVAEATLAVADTELGEVLVDGEGLTVYVFDPDDQGAPTCYDQCADNWPPLLEEDPAAGEDVEETLIGTTERDDGEVQVTYDDWPLYHWQGDEEPGDVSGQGVQGAWWVVGADGTPMRDTEPEDGEDAAGAGDGDGAGY